MLTDTEHALISHYAKEKDPLVLRGLIDSLEYRGSPLSIIVRRSLQVHNMREGKPESRDQYGIHVYPSGSKTNWSLILRRDGPKHVHAQLQTSSNGHHVIFGAPLKKKEAMGIQAEAATSGLPDAYPKGLPKDPNQLARYKAPAGGAIVNNQFYVGGGFIPKALKSLRAIRASGRPIQFARNWANGEVPEGFADLLKAGNIGPAADLLADHDHPAAEAFTKAAMGDPEWNYRKNSLSAKLSQARMGLHPAKLPNKTGWVFRTPSETGYNFHVVTRRNDS